MTRLAIGGLNVANVLAFVIVARWVNVRLHGEHGLRLGVRLSDDCYRSVAVWAKGIVKAHPAGMIPRAVVALFRKGKPAAISGSGPGSKLGGGITA